MTVSNETVKQLYTGNGSQVNFAIPFAFISGDADNEVLVNLVDAVTGAKTLQVINSDYTLDPAGADPTTVIMGTAPSSVQKLLVERDLSLTQIVDYINSGTFYPESHEKGIDRAILMVQQVKDALNGTIRLNILDEAGISTAIEKIPTPSAGYILGVNATEDGLAWLEPAQDGAPGADGLGVPAGGGSGQVLAKASGVSYDTEWVDSSGGSLPPPTGGYTMLESDSGGADFLETAPIVYDGISALTGATFTSSGIKDTLNKIIRITYTPPTVSLVGTGSSTLRERGDTVTNPTLTATVVKKSDPVASLAFYDGTVAVPNLIGSVHVGDPPVPNGGVDTQVTAVAFSTNRTFSARVIDDGSTGGPTNVDTSVTYSFVYPYYYGAGAASLTAAQVAALTKQIINETTSTSRTFSVTAGQVVYFAYPASYGVLTSILDINAFQTISDWTLRVENITGLDGNPVSYNIYEFNNPIGVTGSYTYTFVQ